MNYTNPQLRIAGVASQLIQNKTQPPSDGSGQLMPPSLSLALEK